MSQTGSNLNYIENSTKNIVNRVQDNMSQIKRKPMYPGGDPNYRENSAKFYANRAQVKTQKNIVYYNGYSSNYSNNYDNDYYDEIEDQVRIVTFKTPKHKWEEEWYESDINCMSSNQAWMRYIKLRDLQLFAENNNEINNWNKIQDLIEQHPYIFEHNKYGYEFGELTNDDSYYFDDYYQNNNGEYDYNDYDDNDEYYDMNDTIVDDKKSENNNDYSDDY
jgi:hypothetical protein